MQRFEIIVVDDGSTEDIASAMPTGVTVLRTGHSGMPGAARNHGVAHARGRYLAFLDSDDLWHPLKVRKQIDVFSRAPQAQLVHCRERWLRDGREISQKSHRHRREGDIFADAVVKCIVGPSTVMLSRELFDAVGGFREDLEVAEDYEFFLRALATSPAFYLDEKLVDKRDRLAPQLSRKYDQIEGFRLQGLGDIIADCLEALDRAEATGDGEAGGRPGRQDATHGSSGPGPLRGPGSVSGPGATGGPGSVSGPGATGGPGAPHGPGAPGGLSVPGESGAPDWPTAVLIRAIDSCGAHHAGMSAEPGAPAGHRAHAGPGEGSRAHGETGEHARPGKGAGPGEYARPGESAGPGEYARPGEGAGPGEYARPGASWRTRWGAAGPSLISAGQLRCALEEYRRKCDIFAMGAAKRGREHAAQLHREVVHACDEYRAKSPERRAEGPRA